MSKLIEKELCPRCGNGFECSKSAKCWCYSYSLPDELLFSIQDQHMGCLCPNCLDSLLEEKIR